MKLKCTMSNASGVTVGETYDVMTKDPRLSPIIENDFGVFYFLNGINNLSIVDIGSVIAEFEVVE